jgi:hypothetical protein
MNLDFKIPEIIFKISLSRTYIKNRILGENGEARTAQWRIKLEKSEFIQVLTSRILWDTWIEERDSWDNKAQKYPYISTI